MTRTVDDCSLLAARLLSLGQSQLDKRGLLLCRRAMFLVLSFWESRCFKIGTRRCEPCPCYRSYETNFGTLSLPHGGFGVLGRVWDTRDQQLSPVLGDDKHVLKEKSLTVDVSDLLEVNRGSCPQWSEGKSRKQVGRMHLPERHILSV